LNIVYIIILSLAILLNATANILVKLGMRRIGPAEGVMDIARKAITRPELFAGIVSFILAFVAYSFILTRLNLSIAYPIMISMSLVIVVMVSQFFLKEAITPFQIAGFLLIIFGVWMVAK